jgi:hypothetical protein
MTTQPLLFYVIDFQVQILVGALKLVDFIGNCPLATGYRLPAAGFWLRASGCLLGFTFIKNLFI